MFALLRDSLKRPDLRLLLSGNTSRTKLPNMQAVAGNAVLLAVFNLGEGEIIIILALVLILFGAKKLPDLAQGLGQGISKFRDAIDDEASDAGRSAGGIYGKRAVQALTPDNQVAELYNPGVFERKAPRNRRSITELFLRFWRRIAACWK